MLLNSIFPEDPRTTLCLGKSLFMQKQQRRLAESEKNKNGSVKNPTLSASDWISNSKGKTHVNGHVTLVLPIDCSCAVWSAPFNVSIFPDSKGVLYIIVYATNQTSISFGKQFRMTGDGFRTAKCHAHFAIRSFPPFDEFHKDEDPNVEEIYHVKHKGFYEVDVHLVNACGIHVRRTVPYMNSSNRKMKKPHGGDRVIEYLLTNGYTTKYRKGSVGRCRKPFRINNDSGRDRSALAISDSDKRMNREITVTSIGSDLNDWASSIAHVTACTEPLVRSKWLNPSMVSEHEIHASKLMYGNGAWMRNDFRQL